MIDSVSSRHPSGPQPNDSVEGMAPFTWTLQDGSGTDLRVTEPFASKQDAEAWMGSEWSSLLEEGAQFVALKEDGDLVYRMGLNEQ